jgi:transposase
MKQYDSQRALAKSLFDRGVRSPFHISKVYKIPLSTTKRYLKRLQRGESLEDRPRAGRPRKLTSSLYRQLSQIKHKYPTKSASFFARYLSRKNGVPVGVRSVQKALRYLGFRWRLRPRRRLTSSQKAKRVAFASVHRHDSWRDRWFFDESYFNLYRHGNKCWVKVDTDDAMSLPKLTEAQEKISVGIAVAIRHGRKSALAFLPKNWKASDLVTLFDSTIYPSLQWSNSRKKRNELVIDNDGRHFSEDWKSYVVRKQLRPLHPWPANSPDFNVVENAFGWLKSHVEDMEPRDEKTLKESIQTAWNDLPLSMTETLVESVPRRLEQAIARKGGRTKY